MSLLEKYNLVEKVNKDDSKTHNNKEEYQSEVSEVITEIEHNPVKERCDAIIKSSQEDTPSIELTNDKSNAVQYQKKMMINEIYSMNNIKNSDINTVFMLQNLINALPQNLPQEVIKQSIMNIIGASNIDLKELLSDGQQRLEILEKVMSEYYNQTKIRIEEYKGEIDKLSRLISNYQEQIKIQENMLEEQMNLVKYETQKIGNIMDFFNK